jgi:hypothetical protein
MAAINDEIVKSQNLALSVIPAKPAPAGGKPGAGIQSRQGWMDPGWSLSRILSGTGVTTWETFSGPSPKNQLQVAIYPLFNFFNSADFRQNPQDSSKIASPRSIKEYPLQTQRPPKKRKHTDFVQIILP